MPTQKYHVIQSGWRSARRAAALALALCLLASQMAACTPATGDGAQEQAAPAWEKYAAESVTLDWYVNFSWFTTTWGENLVAKTITEETGVSINFITPGGNEWEKLDAMISSGDLPDLLTLGFWEPHAARIIGEGLVYPLNELADAYDPYFWEVSSPQRLSWYTHRDGNIYSYPNSSYTPADYEENYNIGANQTFLVRSDIYRAIGSPDMTTPEGFTGAIRDATALFPTVGGQPLLAIGLYDFDKDGCYSLEEMLMNFLAIPFEKGGERYDRYSDPDYIRWLKVFRKLREDGYISDELFLDRRAQVVEKVGEGRYFCMIYQHTDIADQQIYLYEKDPEGSYIAIDGPSNRRGDSHTLPGVGINGWTVTMVSKNSKAPERAIALMSYLMSEHGQKLTYCGVEGVTYDTGTDGGPVFKPEVLELLNSDRVEYNSIYGADNTYWMLQDNAMQLRWQPPARPPLSQPREWTFPYTVYMPEYDVSITDPEISAAYQRIREAWGSALPQLLLAPTDEEFDRIFSEYVALREGLGYDLVAREWMRLVEEAKLKLDMDRAMAMGR